MRAARRSASRNIRAFLHNRNDASQILENLTYRGINLEVISSAKNIPFSNKTPTYSDIASIKRDASSHGLFSYDDMYAFAENYIAKYPEIIEPLRYRFPWVFIDEMQDTDLTQDTLLQRLFGDGCVLQRFGDKNQSIFHSGFEVAPQSSFPKDNPIDLPESKRFNTKIAELATPLTAEFAQNLIGNRDVASYKHTIFVFDRTSIVNVLKAYANLIIQEYPYGLPIGFKAKAVGFRKSTSENQNTIMKNFPYNINDYWEGYMPDSSSNDSRLPGYIDYVVKARKKIIETGQFKDGHEILLMGMIEYLRSRGLTNEKGSLIKKTDFVGYLNQSPSHKLVMKSSFLELIVSKDAIKEENWKEIIIRICNSLSGLINNGRISTGNTFFTWHDSAPSEIAAGTNKSASDNIFVHNGIQIHVGTIHSVKGETHNATLILETFEKVHDLKKLISYVKGSGNAMTADDTTKKHMKRIYVGMTRPKELLCLAIFKKHLVEEDCRQLTERGWNIVDLTTFPCP